MRRLGYVLRGQPQALQIFEVGRRLRTLDPDQGLKVLDIAIEGAAGANLGHREKAGLPDEPPGERLVQPARDRLVLDAALHVLAEKPRLVVGLPGEGFDHQLRPVIAPAGGLAALDLGEHIGRPGSRHPAGARGIPRLGMLLAVDYFEAHARSSAAMARS